MYVGITSDLPRRMDEHRTGAVAGFTKRYNLKRLVFAGFHDDIAAAIRREKALKSWRRAWKEALSERENPEREDLFERLFQWRSPVRPEMPGSSPGIHGLPQPQRPSLPLCVLEDHLGALLGDHQGRRGGVARGDQRHGGGVDHPQALGAAHA